MRLQSLRNIAAAVLIMASAGVASADEFNGPRLAYAHVDWDAARAALASGNGSSAAPAAAPDALNALNTAANDRFPDIAASPVPVLLPFDIDAYLRDRSAGGAKDTDSYLSGFRAASFFLAGPTGYDAAFSLRTDEVAEFSDIKLRDPVFVLMSGFATLYSLPPPNAAIEAPPRALETEFPGIRRVILESYLRYSFERFGVTYVASMECFDGSPNSRRLSCKQADRIIIRMLRALKIAGGTPRPDHKPDGPMTIERPKIKSDFTYFGPGRLIPGTGQKGNDGVVDYTVYSKIRFPIAQAPAFANSQSFMNWGDCDQTGRVGRTGVKDGAYRCRVNSKPLLFNEGASENYSYPWRDNFCEHRFYFVGQCGAGYGHQGQDIRPGKCKQFNDGADRCEAYQEDVVAARDSTILRARGQEGLTLIVNAENERVRFRYMHMNPNKMDADGMLSGRKLREGEWVGKVGNYNRKENGTTYHLHFEEQVPTRDGWVRVNPYMTLVSAYERLIGARGAEVKDADMPPVVTTEIKPDKPADASPAKHRGRRHARARRH